MQNISIKQVLRRLYNALNSRIKGVESGLAGKSNSEHSHSIIGDDNGTGLEVNDGLLQLDLYDSDTQSGGEASVTIQNLPNLARALANPAAPASGGDVLITNGQVYAALQGLRDEMLIAEDDVYAAINGVDKTNKYIDFTIEEDGEPVTKRAYRYPENDGSSEGYKHLCFSTTGGTKYYVKVASDWSESNGTITIGSDVFSDKICSTDTGVDVSGGTSGFVVQAPPTLSLELPDGITIQYEHGMTWREFVASAYNVPINNYAFSIDDEYDQVWHDCKMLQVDSNTVYPDDVIDNTLEYTWYYD